MDAWLDELAESGRVRLRDAEPLDADGLAVCVPALERLDARIRRELPPDPPPFSLRPALWATQLVHRACQLLAFRALPAELVAEAFAVPCPGDPSPARAYSVDLLLRWLPDLLRAARGFAAGDPLVTALQELGRAWPLSSVGIAGLDGPDGTLPIDSFWSDPCLRALYLDRVLLRGDASRLSDPRVRAAVRAALGEHPQLQPALARALAEEASAR